MDPYKKVRVSPVLSVLIGAFGVFIFFAILSGFIPLGDTGQNVAKPTLPETDGN